MQFITLATLATLFAAAAPAFGAALPEPETNELEGRAGRTVAFNVAPSGTACGKGTTIICNDATNTCKGNFTPNQASIVITQAAGNCHVSLYSKANQQGDIVQRLNTDTTGTCVWYSANLYASYGIYCS